MKSRENVVDFALLCELANEIPGDDPIATAISTLAMDDIPMSDAVIKLGVVVDAILPDYHNGWSGEEV